MTSAHEDPRSDATLLLRRLQDGDVGAANDLLPIIYAELHALARRAMSGRVGQTLQTTALMNEAWIKLVKSRGEEWQSRNHFLSVAARAMRSVLIDRARSRDTLKRGGHKVEIDLDEAVDRLEERASDLLALDAALERLMEVDVDLARIVEMRFFGGLSQPAIAEVLGCSLRSVERGWSTARAWLYARLVAGDPLG